MKNKVFIKIAVVLFFTGIIGFENLISQTVEFTPYIGYMTSGKSYTYDGYVRISDGTNYGGILSFGLSPGIAAELTYNHVATDFVIDQGYTNTKASEVYVDYYMIGGVRELNPGEKVNPFGSLSFGMANYYNMDKYDSRQKFAIGLSGGLKIFPTERIGIRLQARMTMPMYFNGLYIGGGTGGASAGVSSTVVMLQGDFTAGLILRLK